MSTRDKSDRDSDSDDGNEPADAVEDESWQTVSRVPCDAFVTCFDVLHRIFSYCEPHTLLRLRLVCRLWCEHDTLLLFYSAAAVLGEQRQRESGKAGVSKLVAQPPNHDHFFSRVRRSVSKKVDRFKDKMKESFTSKSFSGLEDSTDGASRSPTYYPGGGDESGADEDKQRQKLKSFQRALETAARLDAEYDMVNEGWLIDEFARRDGDGILISVVESERWYLWSSLAERFKALGPLRKKEPRMAVPEVAGSDRVALQSNCSDSSGSRSEFDEELPELNRPPPAAVGVGVEVEEAPRPTKAKVDRGWVKVRLPGDPPSWVQIDEGKLPLPYGLDSVQKPTGWIWAGPWRCHIPPTDKDRSGFDIDPADGAGGADVGGSIDASAFMADPATGWRYAVSFRSTQWSPTPSTFSRVRQREWRRKAQPALL
jgi:hypothetical protein